MRKTAATVKHRHKHHSLESPAAEITPIWMQISDIIVSVHETHVKCCTCLILRTRWALTQLDCNQLMGLFVCDCEEPGYRANRELNKGLKDTKRWCGLIPLKHMA